MARVSPIQTNFTAGILSPRLFARVDFNKYFNGAEQLLNTTVLPHGGGTRRVGTRHVAEVKDSSKTTRVVPFEFSVTQAYILEFGDSYIRFFRNEGQIVSGASPVEIASPYGEADLFDLQFAQSADILYIVHPGYAPRKLTRTSHTAWSLTEIDFEDGPYLGENTTGTTLTLSGTSGSVTVTASATTGINGGDGFKATDVGRSIRFNDGTDWTWLEITAHTDSTTVTATIRGDDPANGNASTKWRLGIWSETTGFPATVTFFEERLMFAGATNFPQRIDGSRSGDFENFAPSKADGTVRDDDALAFTLAADQVNVIRWLSAGKKLLIGTVGGEWEMSGQGVNEPLTPTNVQVLRATTYGSANVEPVRIGDIVLFVQRAGKKLRELTFSFERDNFVAPDLLLLAEHLIQSSGIKEMAYAQEPDSILWAVRNDGRLLGLTYERAQDVIGWHVHTFGGSLDGSDEPACESAAVIPSPTIDHSQLWLVVKRTIDGGTKRYIEFMEDPFTENTAQEDAFFIDSGLTYDGAATTTISGLDHLEGETVTVLGDGAVRPSRTVSSGSITLDREVSKAQIGLSYTSRLRTLRLDAGANEGTAQGKIKRIHHVIVRLWRSLGMKVGPDANKLDVVPFGPDKMNNSPTFFTGDKKVRFRGGYTRAGQITVQQDQPLPLTILGLMPQLNTFDA